MPGVEPRRGRRESVKVKATVVPTTSNRHTKPRMVDRLNHVLVRYRSHANVYASPPTQCFPREYIFWDRFTTTSWSLRLQPHFDASAGGPIFLLFFINCYRHNFLLIGQECIARLDTGRLASSLSQFHGCSFPSKTIPLGGTSESCTGIIRAKRAFSASPHRNAAGRRSPTSLGFISQY
jgi:hypothetical protein